MRLLALNRLPLLTAATISVAMGIRICALVSGAPTLDALRTEAGNAARVAGSTASASVVTQAQAAPLTGAHEAGAKPADAAPASKVAAAAAPFEVPSDAERTLLEDLRRRRSQVEAREQALSQRETTLGAAEKRLSDRVNELAGLEARLQGLEKNLKDHDNANWAGMVKLYETMRPRDAAAILNAIDKTVLLELLDRMKPAKASPILAAMDGDKARQATADLATRRTQSVTLAN